MEYMASLELALKNEKTEMEFYLNEANRSKNALAKSMFNTLAKDEQEHMKRIKVLHEKLVAQGSWPTDVPIEVSDTNIRKVLDEMVGKTGSSEDHDDDDVKALKKAVAFEQKGSEFYAKLSKESKTNREQTFFDFLSKIEREHMLSLSDSLSFLEDPEGWMMQHERSGLDGA